MGDGRGGQANKPRLLRSFSSATKDGLVGRDGDRSGSWGSDVQSIIGESSDELSLSPMIGGMGGGLGRKSGAGGGVGDERRSFTDSPSDYPRESHRKSSSGGSSNGGGWHQGGHGSRHERLDPMEGLYKFCQNLIDMLLLMGELTPGVAFGRRRKLTQLMATIKEVQVSTPVRVVGLCP